MENITEMRESLRQAEARDVQACGEAIQRALKEHGCTLSSKPVLTEDGRIVSQVSVTKSVS